MNESIDMEFFLHLTKRIGDTRIYINSVDEGSIWITITNRPLETGDYITICDLSGYGAKQSDDILHIIIRLKT
jgi:hypothetical protein